MSKFTTVETMHVPSKKIGILIGSGGRTLRRLEDKHDARITIDKTKQRQKTVDMQEVTIIVREGGDILKLKDEIDGIVNPKLEESFEQLSIERAGRAADGSLGHGGGCKDKGDKPIMFNDLRLEIGTPLEQKEEEEKAKKSGAFVSPTGHLFLRMGERNIDWERIIEVLQYGYCRVDDEKQGRVRFIHVYRDVVVISQKDVKNIGTLKLITCYQTHKLHFREGEVSPEDIKSWNSILNCIWTFDSQDKMIAKKDKIHDELGEIISSMEIDRAKFLLNLHVKPGNLFYPLPSCAELIKSISIDCYEKIQDKYGALQCNYDGASNVNVVFHGSASYEARKNIEIPLNSLISSKEDNADQIVDKLSRRLDDELISDVNVYDMNGWTPLLWSCFRGLKEALKIMLSHGGKVDSVERKSWHALHLTVYSGDANTLKLLLDWMKHCKAMTQGGSEVEDGGGDASVVSEIARHVLKLPNAEEVFKSGASINLSDVDFSGKSVIHMLVEQMQNAGNETSQKNVLERLQLILDTGRCIGFDGQVQASLKAKGGAYNDIPMGYLKFGLEELRKKGPSTGASLLGPMEEMQRYLEQYP